MKLRSATIFMTAINVGITAFGSPKYIPVVSGLFSTGQWYYQGEKSDLGGNAAITFVPAIQFSKGFSVLPTIRSAYHGTRSAEELAGGNTFFHDTWENGVNIKTVQGLNSNWNLRQNAGYRFKWFRETVEESWNNGLYDYRIYNAGTEIERHWNKKTSIALGYDFSYTQFPNYQSLESDQSADRSREFAGEKVLDTRTHLVSLRTRAPLPWHVNGSWQIFLAPRDYTQQHVVALSGLFTSERRQDMYIGSTFGFERVFNTPKRSKLITSVQYGYAGLNSNQNHYDARQTTFVSDFYDYDQNSIGTQLTLAFGSVGGNPMLIETGYAYAHRDYRSRPIQAEDGAYKIEKLYQIDQSFNIGFSYPLSKNFRVRTSSTFGQSKSNNDYEAVYRYNYHNAEYQFGFTYDY